MKQDHEAGQQRINQEICYAKSANAHHEKITVREHLEKVSQLAQVFGEEIGMSNAAQLAGISENTAIPFSAFWMVRCSMWITHMREQYCCIF